MLREELVVCQTWFYHEKAANFPSGAGLISLTDLLSVCILRLAEEIYRQSHNIFRLDRPLAVILAWEGFCYEA